LGIFAAESSRWIQEIDRGEHCHGDALRSARAPLPNDDADELRAAFRRAGQARSIPDINSEDLDAGLKFPPDRACQRDSRRCPSKRAAYDHLLALGRHHKQEQAGGKAGCRRQGPQGSASGRDGALPGISVIAGRRLCVVFVQLSANALYRLQTATTEAVREPVAIVAPCRRRGGQSVFKPRRRKTSRARRHHHLGDCAGQPRTAPGSRGTTARPHTPKHAPEIRFCLH